MTHKQTYNYLRMVENASPTNPPSGHIGIYFKADGLAYQRDSTGNEILLGGGIVTGDEFGQEADLSADNLIFPKGTLRNLTGGLVEVACAVSGRSRRLLGVIATDTTYSSFNGGVASATGTQSLSLQTDSRYINSATTAVINTNAGVNGNSFFGASRFVSLALNPTLEGVIRTSTLVTLCRVWFGIFENTPNNADTLTVPGVGFRFNATGGWTPCAFDGVTQTTGTTIGTVAINSRYLLRIRVVGTSAYFSVDNGTEQVLSTNVPSVAASFALVIFTTSAAIRNILFSRITVEVDI